MKNKVTLPTGEVIPERRNNNGFVRWGIFIAITGIIIGMITLLFNSQFKLVDQVRASMNENTEIRTQLSQIQTDISWIKREFERRR